MHPNPGIYCVEGRERGLCCVEYGFTAVPSIGGRQCGAMSRELGLQIDYNKRNCVFKFVRKLFASPFLPEEQIPVTFDVLKRTVTSDGVRELTNYIERT